MIHARDKKRATFPIPCEKIISMGEVRLIFYSSFTRKVLKFFGEFKDRWGKEIPSEVRLKTFLRAVLHAWTSPSRKGFRVRLSKSSAAFSALESYT